MQERATLAQAVAAYLSSLGPEARQANQQEINRFLRWFGGDRPLSRLTPPEVANYAESLASGGGDFQRRLEPVRAFLAHAKKEGLTAGNLAVHLRVKKQPQRPTSAPATLRQESIRLTEEGHHNLRAEVERLRAERPRLAQEIRRAAADKDFRENAPLDAARERQGHVEARIRELEAILGAATVAQAAGHEKADLGSTVVLADLATQEEVRYTLVHPNEVSLAQGKISIASPLGKALLGRQDGQNIEVVAPAGTRRYQIRSVTH